MTNRFDKLIREILALEQPSPIAPPKPAPPRPKPGKPKPGPEEKPAHPLQPKPGKNPKPKAEDDSNGDIKKADFQAFLHKRGK